MDVFRVALRGDIFDKGQRSDGGSALAWKVVGFLEGGFVGVAAEAAAEAAVGAAADGGTGDTVDSDADAAGFVRCSTKRRTCICNVILSLLIAVIPCPHSINYRELILWVG